ncbi:hypothetical protein IIA28_06295 [candidate division KSB1 bacterium]|nr:hypothetical protein [candidate division KSB1 bacterium]
MIDIHSHVLPKIDDGPVTWQDAIAMLHQAEEDGTKDRIRFYVSITLFPPDRMAYEIAEEEK